MGNPEIVFNGKRYKYNKSTGYYIFYDKDYAKRNGETLHRAIWEFYSGKKIPKGYVIHHIDGNRLNNKLENLKWVSEEENAAEAIHSPRKSKCSQNPLEEEEWKYFRDTIYQVSNKGRIKNTKTNRITYGSHADCGYQRFEIHFENGKRKQFLVHQLVYECFVSPNFDKINHINGIKTDNRVENLESVSHQENMIKACYETNAWNFCRVAQYDKEGNFIREYANASEAGRAMGILPSSMRNCIRLREGRHKDFIFKWIEDEA